MRIVLYAGKGGVGKTTMSSATGVECARRGRRTLVMSLDPAHSLSDAFDLPKSLLDTEGGRPVRVTDNLWIQELDLQRELDANWGEVFRYIASLIQTTGIRDVLAEELAILPGMEELASLLHINRYAREGTYDVVVLDCAPTGESMRFVSMPTSLEWYMQKIFNIERTILKVVRPVARHLTSIPLPTDDYFAALQRLFEKLEGVEQLLQNPQVTTARLVTNPEKMVLKETQRAFTYFHLFDLTVDAVIVNRILPADVRDGFFEGWRRSQQNHIEEAEHYFAPVPVWHVELARGEMLGLPALEQLADTLFRDRDPTAVYFDRKAFEFAKEDGAYVLTMHVPFLTTAEIDVHKSGDELILRLGSFKRFVALPRRMAHLEPTDARLEGGRLRIVFGGPPDGQEAT